MEILLWLVPAALVTLLAAWGAGVAARRDEAERIERIGPEAATAPPEPRLDERDDPVGLGDLEDFDDLGDGVSAPRPARGDGGAGSPEKQRGAERDEQGGRARDDRDDRHGPGPHVRRTA